MRNWSLIPLRSSRRQGGTVPPKRKESWDIYPPSTIGPGRERFLGWVNSQSLWLCLLAGRDAGPVVRSGLACVKTVRRSQGGTETAFATLEL